MSAVGTAPREGAMRHRQQADLKIGDPKGEGKQGPVGPFTLPPWLRPKAAGENIEMSGGGKKTDFR